MDTSPTPEYTLITPCRVMSLSASPPLAPITATLRWAAWVVENCRAMAETGAWNLENILTLVLRTGR